MPANIEDDRPRRRRQAVVSALVSGGWMLVYAALLLWLRSRWALSGWLGGLLVLLASLDLALLIPLAVSLKKRVQEIEGGEEDEARNY